MMRKNTPKTGGMMLWLPAAILIALGAVAGCSSSTDLDTARIVRTDTLSKPRPKPVTGEVILSAAADTVSYYLIIDSLIPTRDTLRPYDTVFVTQLAYPALDSVRSLAFSANSGVSATVDTSIFPPVVRLSGLWSARYNGASFYPAQLLTLAITLDSLAATPGGEFAATPSPPNSSSALMTLLQPFAAKLRTFPSLHFAVTSLALPTAGQPGSGRITLRVSGASHPVTESLFQQGSVLRHAIQVRFGATMQISY